MDVEGTGQDILQGHNKYLNTLGLNVNDFHFVTLSRLFGD